MKNIKLIIRNLFEKINWFGYKFIVGMNYYNLYKDYQKINKFIKK